MKKITLNDNERGQWIDNDEGLYNWWLCSKQSMRDFIRENRQEITRIILKRLNQKPRGQS